MPPRSPTFQAFKILFRAASPQGRDVALRAAIGALVNERSTRIAARPPTIATSASPSRWEGLRLRLHDLAAAGPAARREIADKLGVAPTTLSRMLGPMAPGPGAAVIDRAEAWLAGRDREEAHPRAPRTLDRAADSPSAKPNGPAEARQGGHLRAGPLPANRLTREQREALAGHLALDPDARHRLAGITREVAEKAVAGQALAPQIVARLAAYLRPSN